MLRPLFIFAAQADLFIVQPESNYAVGFPTCSKKLN